MLGSTGPIILNNLILYGGTFDPVHQGHMNTALAVQNHFHFDCFSFLPCRIPLLKEEAHASGEQRVAMLTLALAELPATLNFKIDCTEIERDSPSYMVTTLSQLREKRGDEFPITLLLGQDTFYQLPAWHQWEKLLGLCNLLVIKRPSVVVQPPKALQLLLRHHENQQEGLLLTEKAGVIQQFNAGQYPISSTEIRRRLREGESISSGMLPISVMEYINAHGLYR
ncbi:nicotinate-nucleotide adenylyltransferase [Legionella taurinensis]|uniref:Probable nicotinate-nucleotide adenylyltransferase n=1 Tax=Legionella taurinensis TaxID=70611 RepID=A0A3A5M0Q1_9GAMM|nr:nicotinate-nucleotide adenylyltransferase [Legionella taurinensis]RJT68949.1 nicotinate-nucleotide adenylyltransferase [Legionella taurinensis]